MEFWSGGKKSSVAWQKLMFCGKSMFHWIGKPDREGESAFGHDLPMCTGPVNAMK